MPELQFFRLDENHLRLYQDWFQDDELKRRYEPPTPQWFNYVRNTPGIFAWMIYDADIPVGQLQLDTSPDRSGYVGLVVNPALRQQGYGSKILKTFLDRPEVAGLIQLEVTIEPDNLASLRCFQQVGFIQMDKEPDGEGFLHFIFRLDPATNA
jgi:L-amino acid N-acyltransferase YncA